MNLLDEIRNLFAYPLAKIPVLLAPSSNSKNTAIASNVLLITIEINFFLANVFILVTFLMKRLLSITKTLAIFYFLFQRNFGKKFIKIHFVNRLLSLEVFHHA